MKKIFIVLAMLLTFGSCFADILQMLSKTHTGYIINCENQTIEKSTLCFSEPNFTKKLFELGTFFFIEDDKVYKAEALKLELKYKPLVSNGKVFYEATTKSNAESNNDNISVFIGKCEKESMKEAIIDYIKKVENNQKLDLSDLLENVKNMEFDNE